MKIQNILIVSIILVTLFSISLVSSAGFDWRSYGNPFTALWNAQSTDTVGRFNEGIVNITISNGYDTTFRNNLEFQPMVTSFNLTGQFENFLVFPNGNFLQVYDKGLNIRQEIDTGGNALANIDIMKWDDISGFEIVGIWEINSSDVVFRVYKYDPILNLFTTIFEQNFTTSIRTGFAGVRHSNNEAYFLIPLSNVGGFFQSDFIQINDSGIFNQQLINRSTCFYDEPLAFTDVDNDGDVEFMTFCNEEFILFDETGTIELNVSVGLTGLAGGIRRMTDARLVKADATNQWKIATYRGNAVIQFPNILKTESIITMWKLDGSQLWQRSFGDIGVHDGKMAVGTFFNVPNWFERWILGQEGGLETAVFVSDVGSQSVPNIDNFRFVVFKADNGDTIKSKTFLSRAGWTSADLTHSLTIVDINNNGANDFIISRADGYIFYDLDNDDFIIEKVGTGFPEKEWESCIPADLTFDNSQEIICTSEDETILYASTFINQNAFINSVSYDPSISIQVNTTLTMFIFATDPEGDSPLTYRHRCDAGENFSIPNNNPTQQCFYDSIGIKQNTVSVHDPFNSTFVDFVQTITVTLSESGFVCGNLICEGTETNFNCAIDCPLGNVSQSGLSGSIPLPTELVELDNTNKGLLPEIYFGTIGFMSSVLSPTIVLVFLFFLVMIMITVGVIIKKIGQRIGGLSG